MTGLEREPIGRYEIVDFGIAGVSEDPGDGNCALEWIERAFEHGVLPSHFESRPLLRGLVADKRYRILIEQSGKN